VTVLLYVEVARRALKKLRRPEIYILFYMCGATMAAGGEGWLWRQFLAQSEELRRMGLTQYIPSWYAPTDIAVLGKRSFMMKAWLWPLLLAMFMMLIQRLDHFGLGYVMYRLTADVEELPFPMAPVGAAGMTALADASNETESWRLKVFCMGGALGIAFGFVYLAIPNITSALFSKPLRIIPIPFVDMMRYTESFLPAMPVMICFDIGLIISGMVMPFWAMMGSLAGLIFTLIVNPALYHAGVLESWEPGIGAIKTVQANYLDFYFSFHLGLLFAVAAIGIVHCIRSFRSKSRELDEQGAVKVQWKNLFRPPAGRGDFPIWVAILIYFISTTTFISLAYWLVNYCSGPLIGRKFPLALLLFYGFIYTPLISYISTRMEGIVGQQMQIPMVREATFILSGYKGAAIWFAPIPLHNYASQALSFRTMELTGCKFTSLIKAEVLIYPLSIVGTLVFASFIWSLGPVPSEMYPYANQFWELRAYQQGLIYSATLPGEAASPFREAFSPGVLGLGLFLALGTYGILTHFNLPIFFVYGVVRGLDQSLPHAVIPTVLGAFIGRFVCAKRFGEKWPQYRVVFAAGFGAGIGLITMFSLGVVFMSKSASPLPL